MTLTYALPIPAQANLRSKLSAQRGRSQNRREADESVFGRSPQFMGGRKL